MASGVPYQPVSVSRFKLDDPFWGPRLETLVRVTLPAQFDQIARQTSRLDNFKRVADRQSGGFSGRYYDDSDVYKWLQACATALAQRDDSDLRSMADEAIEAIVRAQAPDGYLNTFFQLEHPELKFRNLAMMHELYCMGHFLEAAAEWFSLLGEERLMFAADKLVHLLEREFGEHGRAGFCGHEELELGLIAYSAARAHEGSRRLAKRMIDLRGQRPSPFESELDDEVAMALSPWARRLLCKEEAYNGEYVQDHLPLREQTIVVGHSVRAMYLFAAATDFMQEDQSLQPALEALWRNMTERRMYVTGGIGSTASNEGFSHDYDLPNFNGYAETCASIGLAIWGNALASATGQSTYADVVERALFNGCLAGISSDGKNYFYENPLESRRNHGRRPWFECACCPPNIARLIGWAPRFALSEKPSGLRVLFPLGGVFQHQAGGTFRIESEYPYSGRFAIVVDYAPSGRFDLSVRMPAWCDDLTISLDGVQQEADYADGYVSIEREWQKGDRLEVEWSMPPYWLRSHPMVFDNSGKVALCRGPLVYCLEETDSSIEARHFAADTGSEVEIAGQSLLVDGHRLSTLPSDELYAIEFESDYVATQATFIPYFNWSNRGASSMAVWIDEA